MLVPNMKISAVSAYVLTKHNISVSRITVYNWIKLGVAGTKLHVVESPSLRGLKKQYKTREEWVDEFINATKR